MVDNFTRFHKIRLKSIGVITRTDKQADGQTDTGEDIITSSHWRCSTGISEAD